MSIQVRSGVSEHLIRVVEGYGESIVEGLGGRGTTVGSIRDQMTPRDVSRHKTCKVYVS